MWADARDSCLPHVSVAATEEAAGITYYRLRVRQHADARTEWQVLRVRVCVCVCGCAGGSAGVCVCVRVGV
jgi:hypothetical protein